ncbi:MAG: hypothetical protein ACXVPQ_10660 [Bacteroidia bacterium]
MAMRKLFFILPLICVMLSSCFTSMYSTREPALVKNADIDETLKVSKDEMQKQGISQGLGLWVLRDQVVTPAQARIISELYLSRIDSIKSEFSIWHSSWAIANLYRFGNEAVKAELETAYQKAKKQPERLSGNTKKYAESHINGEKMVTGFIHAGGRYYAKRHLVVPGNRRYIQSYEDYHKTQKK